MLPYIKEEKTASRADPFPPNNYHVWLPMAILGSWDHPPPCDRQCALQSGAFEPPGRRTESGRSREAVAINVSSQKVHMKIGQKPVASESIYFSFYVDKVSYFSFCLLFSSSTVLPSISGSDLNEKNVFKLTIYLNFCPVVCSPSH